MVNSKVGEGSEDYDLKPTNFFFPERDFLGGKLTSEKTKQKLHDEFEGEIVLEQEAYNTLLKQLEEDSAFLCDMKAIDYSLFVIRRKYKKQHDDGIIIPEPADPQTTVRWWSTRTGNGNTNSQFSISLRVHGWLGRRQ